MGQEGETQAITPPTRALVVRPGGNTAVAFMIFSVAVIIFVVISAVAVSPFLLLMLIPFVPALVLVPLYRMKGFVNVTANGFDLSGFRGKIVKHVDYADIAQVVLAKHLTLSARVSNVGYAVVFLNKLGDQLFFLWDYQYSKDSLNELFALFEPKDTVTYEDTVWLRDLKKGYLEQRGEGR